MPITTEPKGPKPPLAGLVKLQILYSTQFAGGAREYTAANIMHIRWSDDVNHPPLDLSTLASDFATHFNTRFGPSLSASWAQIGVVATSLGGDGQQGQVVGTVVGTGAGAALPPQSAVTITWKAAIGWRGGRPRTYLPGVPANQTTATGTAQLLSAFSSNLATQATDFISDVNALSISGANPILGMPSYFTKGAFRPVPLFFPFSSAVVHDRVDSQRRRSGKESTFPID